MDIRGHEASRGDTGHDATDSGVGEATMVIGTDERRMHVRAYNQWVSLLKGRDYPSVEDLDPAGNADFGAHGVLLDFSDGVENPAIRFLGRRLRDECSLDQHISRINQVPARSLLSRLTDHYLQIIANRAPIGFEAEFVGTRGHYTMYRGILMPFSSDGASIDFVYGVINWKELVGEEEQAKLNAELAAAVQAAPVSTPMAEAPIAVWADGPSAGGDFGASAATLAECLTLARESAIAAQAAHVRSRCALYKALGRAHDFALIAAKDVAGVEALLDEAGIARQARAPMTPLVKLVFGADYDKTRVTEYATVLAAAASAYVPSGGLVDFLQSHPGGIRGVVADVRAAKSEPRRPAAARLSEVRDRAPVATLRLDVPAQAGDLIVLVARAGSDGMIDVLGAIEDDAKLTARAAAALK